MLAAAFPARYRKCHWCTYPVDSQNLFPGETPFVLDLPDGIKGFWCNGSCCASFMRKHRTHIVELRYMCAIQDALHHRASVRYKFAPEPFQFMWFAASSELYETVLDPVQREEFLGLCSYYDSQTRTEVSREHIRPVSYNIMDALQILSPDPIPMITLKRRREEEASGPEEVPPPDKVRVITDIIPQAGKKRKSKLSLNKKKI